MMVDWDCMWGYGCGELRLMTDDELATFMEKAAQDAATHPDTKQRARALHALRTLANQAAARLRKDQRGEPRDRGYRKGKAWAA